MSVLKRCFVRRLIIATLGVFLTAVGGTVVLGQNNQAKSLHDAAGSGDVEQLKQYIAKGANLNELDAGGYTALARAIESSQVEAAKVLIQGGANIDTKDPTSKTPLMMASLRGQAELVDALIAKKADVKAKDGYKGTALHAAVQMGYLDITEALVKAGADVNAEDANGQTPLSMARQRNRTEIADYLRQQGAKEPAAMTMSPYGMSEQNYQQGAPQTAPGVYAPRATSIQIDPNAIREQMKKFEGLAAAVQALDQKSEGEQRGWIQRRADNRATLLAATERQFEEELTLVKKSAGEEKAEKTGQAVDDLTAARKKRVEAISSALRDQRRESLQTQSQGQGADAYGRGRGRTTTRGTKGRYGDTGQSGSTSMGPYGSPGARTSPRRPADANQPVIDQETQTLIQAWLNNRTEDKKSLLDAVHRQDLADLGVLQEVASGEEQAKKTGVTILALMMIRQERLQKITQKWREDDERQRKLEERYGPGGVPGRGTPGMPQDNQTGTRRPTRRR